MLPQEADQVQEDVSAHILAQTGIHTALSPYKAPIWAMAVRSTTEEREEYMKRHMQKPAPLTMEQASNSRPAIVEIPGFATADTLDRLDGDVDLYHRVLEMLLPSLDTSLAQFDAALERDDRDAMKSVAHSVRGMAANVGAVALSRIATEVEAVFKAGEATRQQLEMFRVQMEETRRLVESGLVERRLTG